MTAIRISFKKEGRAKYISHLDLNRCMQRGLRRAGIPVWRTQGFNPHPYIVFALPLSLFFESDCEIMDARLDDEMSLDEVKSRLSAHMPEGIVITQVSEPVMKLGEIGFVSYSAALDFYGKNEDELSDAISHILSLDEIIIEKTTKRSSYEINIKDIFSAAKFEISQGQIRLSAVLPAGPENSLNPSCFAEAFKKYAAGCDFENIRRLQIYSKTMKEFK